MIKKQYLIVLLFFFIETCSPFFPKHNSDQNPKEGLQQLLKEANEPHEYYKLLQEIDRQWWNLIEDSAISDEFYKISYGDKYVYYLYPASHPDVGLKEFKKRYKTKMPSTAGISLFRGLEKDPNNIIYEKWLPFKRGKDGRFFFRTISLGREDLHGLYKKLKIMGLVGDDYHPDLITKRKYYGTD